MITLPASQKDSDKQITVHSIGDIIPIGKLEQYKSQLDGTKIVLVKMVGVTGIHTLRLPLHFSSCGRLCDIGNQAWAQGNTEWELASNVSVVDIIPDPRCS